MSVIIRRQEEEQQGKAVSCTSIDSVNALTKGANKVDLVTELDGTQALFIEQELERWLKLDQGVGREIDS